MPSTKYPQLRRLLRALRTAAVLSAAVFLAIIALNWCYHFYPRDATEVMDPMGNSNRAFTEVEGFVDLSVDLYAADWPWTFIKPAFLGDFYWPEIQKSSGAYWSADGSVLAFQTHRHEDLSPLFRSAYDYREHEIIKPDYRVESPLECNLHIVSLLKKRGGMVQPENRLGDFKSDPTVVFPVWGWIAPGVLLAGGAMILRLSRGKQG